MVTSSADQTGGSFNELGAVEKEAWEAMTAELRLVEKFDRKPDERWFSWDNSHRRRKPSSSASEESDTNANTTGSQRDRILKRLDMIYLSDEMKKMQKKYEILENLNRSDHAPVLMILEVGTRKVVHKARFCMNGALLKETDFKNKISEIWEDVESQSREKGDELEVTLRKCLRKITKEMKQRGKEVSRERRAWTEEKKGRIKLLAKLDMKWATNGDVPSRMFFNLFKARQKQLEIECLVNETGSEVRDAEGMCDAAEAHFKRLLTEEKDEVERIEDINFILERMEDKLSPNEKSAMEKPLNEGEIKAAVDI
ncbi:hypothetical protein R1sor_009441 [Riccia sorocarpa]|uniref:Uncharacterized protein n=1 Tax=Riccia sorocarpa TaxID=122646 RepID=A0ABD3HYL9_9MARC